MDIHWLHRLCITSVTSRRMPTLSCTTCWCRNLPRSSTCAQRLKTRVCLFCHVRLLGRVVDFFTNIDCLVDWTFFWTKWIQFPLRNNNHVFHESLATLAERRPTNTALMVQQIPIRHIRLSYGEYVTLKDDFFTVIIIIVIIIPMTVYGAVIMARPLREFSRLFDECRLSARWLPTLKPNQPTWPVGLPVSCYLLCPPSPFIIVIQPESWYTFYRLKEDGMLSQPRHCREGVQSVLKAVYLGGCHDKHICPRWDLNPSPVTLQPGVLPLDHCDLQRQGCEQLAYGCYLTLWRPEVKLVTIELWVQRPNH